MATPRAAEHRDLEGRLRWIEDKLRDLTTATLFRSQLSVTEGDFLVSGGGDVVVRDGGNLRLLDDDGNTVFDAVSGPVKFASAEDSATGVTVNTNLTTKTAATVTVPDGYTQALVIAAVEVCARNTRSVLDYMWLGTPASVTDVDPGHVGSASVQDVDLRTGLSGGDEVTVSGRVASGGGGWGSDPFNSVAVHLVVLFMR